MRWRCERTRARFAAALGGLLLAGFSTASRADALRYCEHPPALSAAQQDRLFRFSALVKAELERSGQPLALIARSGLDLHRFGQRYSHAGVSLAASRNTPWSVRQLYYACDERKPRLYDQGLVGFVLGSNDPALGYVSLVLLPAPEAQALEQAALDDREALAVLGSRYSANAYPFSLSYQNCNQWVAELLAQAWGNSSTFDTTTASGGDDASAPRAGAQRWLHEQGYTPTRFDVNAGWMWLGVFVPWLHFDDHPPADLHQAVYRVSMPASIESFVRQRLPGASRIELCHTERYAVIHRGWEPIAEGCLPGEQDTVLPLD